MKRSTFGALLFVLFAGCGGLAGSDAGMNDSGPPAADAGLDAGTVDGGAQDAGSVDAGSSDAGSSDAGSSDAGSSDAGSSDAGSSDAGRPDAGGTNGCPYVLCEDFERYDAGTLVNGKLLGPWKISVGGAGASMVLDGSKSDGGRVLHVKVPAGTGASGTLTQSSPGGLVPGNNLFGRAQIFFSDEADAGLANGVHSWIFRTGGAMADGGAVSMNMSGGAPKVGINYNGPRFAGAGQNLAGGNMTTGAWHCLQWQYDGSGSPPMNLLRVWLDGTQVIDVPATKNWDLPTPFDTFDFGFTHYQTVPNPVDVAFDDFALNDSMIPCP